MTPTRYRSITGTALMLLIAIVVTGASVRLTGSGLGCSDWPNCERGQLVADLEVHAMIEFINRVITGVVSVAVMAAVLGSMLRRPRRPDLIRLSQGLVAGLLGQIVLGGIVVLSHLNPWLVLGHFSLSMVLVANAVVLHAYADLDQRPATRPGRGYRWPVTALASLAIFMGTLVTGAGPHSGSRHGEPIERLPFTASSVARVHALVVAALIITVLATIWHLRRVGAPSAEQWRLRLVLVSLLAQAAIGYVQYFAGVPVVLVGIHIAGATFVWIAVIWFHLDVSPEPDEIATIADGSPSGESILVP